MTENLLRTQNDLSCSPDGEALRTTRAILLAFCRDVRRSGATPLVAVFPNDSDVASMKLGGGRAWGPLVADLRRGGCPVIDLGDRFEKEGASVPVRELFGRWHYSALGNRIAAQGIGSAIEALHPTGGKPSSGGAAGARLAAADALAWPGSPPMHRASGPDAGASRLCAGDSPL